MNCPLKLDKLQGGFHSKVRNSVQAQGRQELFGRRWRSEAVGTTLVRGRGEDSNVGQSLPHAWHRGLAAQSIVSSSLHCRRQPQQPLCPEWVGSTCSQLTKAAAQVVWRTATQSVSGLQRIADVWPGSRSTSGIGASSHRLIKSQRRQPA